MIVRTVINGLTFDGATQDPMQQAVRDSLIAFMAATAQSQAEVTKEAQRQALPMRKRMTTARNIGDANRPLAPSSTGWSAICSIRVSLSRLSPRPRGLSANRYIEFKPNLSGSLQH